MKPAHSSGPNAIQAVLFQSLLRLGDARSIEELICALENSFSEAFDSKTSFHLNPLLKNTYYDAKPLRQEDLSFHNETEASSQALHTPDPNAPATLLGMTIGTQDDPIGSLVLKRDQPAYSADELSLLEDLSPLISRAFQVLLSEDHSELQEKQLSLIATVTSRLAHFIKLGPLTAEICRLILDSFHYYYVAVFTVEEESQEILFRASARSADSTQPEFELPAGTKLRIGEHIVGHVAQTGEAILANDVSREPRYGRLESLPETEAELAIPLKIENQTLGVLDVQSDQRNAFTENDIIVLSTLADSIAIALHRVRVYSALEERRDQMEIIAEVTKSISGILDMDQLLGKVVELLHSEFDFPYVHLFLVEHIQNRIVFKTGSGERAQDYKSHAVSYDIKAEKGIIPATVRTGEIQVISDVSKDTRYLPNPFSGSVTGSELTLPLSFHDEVFGVLDLQSDQTNAFSESDIEMLATLSASISIALRNAKLYNSEKWRRRVAERLQEVATYLSGNMNLDEVLPFILATLQDLLPSDLAAIWVLDETDTNEPPGTDSLLHLKTFRTTSDAYPEMKTIQINPEQAWIFNALDGEKARVRTQSETNDPLFAYYGLPQDFSAIATPIIVGGLARGVLTLHHHTPKRYGLESQNICASFAGYIGIALRNFSLFQESQDQAWISTILLQVDKATQSIRDLDELTKLTGQMIMLLIGGKDGGLFLFDDEEQGFYLQSVFGESFSALGLDLPLRLDSSATLTQILETRVPVALPASAGDAPLQDLLPLEPEDTILLFPLVAHDELLGILMHVSDDPYQHEIPEKVLGKQKYSILQGIAQQIAVSIQNINLLDARQEETYISTVLLQVSQAIVSTIDLKESLDKVYYILHMLAGVEALATFRWVEEDQSYELMHAKSEQLRQYQLEKLIGNSLQMSDVPFLEEDRQNKPYIVRVADMEDTFQLLQGPQLSAAEQSEAMMLEPGSSAYIIYKLSVHGENFGLLVCRDPDIPKRERRLELLTGVAQQVSFAFQNQHLEQARTQQERVEQEFQLARQIQVTFLPEKLPEIEGYELDISWETARQVGGDFYDAFRIGPNLYGLVIADVSDKGLAAALYMTVARTLIRAIALESTSPARTLERVNELLLLDSQRGFFVTCFYGVLDTSCGSLVYTNAGHLPPYLLQVASNKVIGLERGGIALGAMETITLPESAVQLAPGDGLVLFTDGITEATNIFGSFYGDKRYHNLLQRAIGASAAEIIRIVGTEMKRFRQNAPLSDDVTQLVLRRLNSLTE